MSSQQQKQLPPPQAAAAHTVEDTKARKRQHPVSSSLSMLPIDQVPKFGFTMIKGKCTIDMIDWVATLSSIIAHSVTLDKRCKKPLGPRLGPFTTFAENVKCIICHDVTSAYYCAGLCPGRCAACFRRCEQPKCPTCDLVVTQPLSRQRTLLSINVHCPLCATFCGGDHIIDHLLTKCSKLPCVDCNGQFTGTFDALTMHGKGCQRHLLRIVEYLSEEVSSLHDNAREDQRTIGQFEADNNNLLASIAHMETGQGNVDIDEEEEEEENGNDDPDYDPSAGGGGGGSGGGTWPGL